MKKLRVKNHIKSRIENPILKIGLHNILYQNITISLHKYFIIESEI